MNTKNTNPLHVDLVSEREIIFGLI